MQRAALALVLLALPAAAGEIRGAARVTDGDTLAIGAAHVRLHGIDAPEAGQSCALRGGGAWDCGAAAEARLRALVQGREVRCVPEELDGYGRVVARCWADGADVGARLVAEGLARAYARYSADYVAVEADARGRRLGLWQGPAEAPWDYRQGFVAAAGANGCRIKGNVTKRGRIYHLPGTPSYERTRINPRRGEAWFCDEAAARAAGFRKAGDR
jgi:endonuclease YncB( thermonuclease family)